MSDFRTSWLKMLFWVVVGAVLAGALVIGAIWFLIWFITSNL